MDLTYSSRWPTMTTFQYEYDEEIRVAVIQSAGCVGIRVSDPGVGIPSDELEHIFEPFTQAKHQHGRLFGGIGLGLPIAQHVAELHGGRIDVTSQVEEGSTFTIFLPVA